MKVNLIAVVMAVAIASISAGCCSFGRGSCKQDSEKCCKSQCDIGVKANVGGASAGAGVNSSGVHVEAKAGK